MRALLFIAFAAWITTSCVPHKDILYFNDLEKTRSGNIPVPQRVDFALQPGDLIEVSISSVSKDASLYFQKSGSEVDKKYGGNTYQISSNGTIDLPLVGEISLAGKTVEEAEETVKSQLVTYLQKPSVNIRLLSFQITVLGEVNTPGIYDIPDANVTILQALGYAGDLSVYGKRDNILIIRETKSGKEYYRINLNDTQSLNTPYFHLQNKDIVYVEPSKGLTSKDDNAYRIFPIILSTLTFIAVIISMTR